MEKVVVNNYGSFDVTFVKAKGSTMWDINKKKYIDFIAGIGVNCLGHNYKPLVKAIAKQAKKQIHISNYFFSDVGICYSLDLLEQTGFDRAYFGNSGAEANEAAIKLARKYGQLNGGEKRKTIVTLESSFHGRTLATLTATGQDKFHPDCFAPYPDGFKTCSSFYKGFAYISLDNYAYNNCRNPNKMMIDQISMDFNKECFDDLSKLLQSIASHPSIAPYVKNLTVRGFLDRTMIMYNPSILLAFESLPYFLGNINSVFMGAFLNNQRMLEPLVDKRATTLLTFIAYAERR